MHFDCEKRSNSLASNLWEGKLVAWFSLDLRVFRASPHSLQVWRAKVKEFELLLNVLKLVVELLVSPYLELIFKFKPRLELVVWPQKAGTNLQTKAPPVQAYVKSPILWPWPTKLASLSSNSCCLSQPLFIKCSSSHRKLDCHNLSPSCKAWSPYIYILIILGAWLWSGQVGGTGATLLGRSLWLGERCSCSRWLCWAISGSLFACENHLYAQETQDTGFLPSNSLGFFCWFFFSFTSSPPFLFGHTYPLPLISRAISHVHPVFEVQTSCPLLRHFSPVSEAGWLSFLDALALSLRSWDTSLPLFLES